MGQDRIDLLPGGEALGSARVRMPSVARLAGRAGEDRSRPERKKDCGDEKADRREYAA